MLPLPPPEVPICRDKDGYPPAMRARLDALEARMIALGDPVRIAESHRTDARQLCLFKFGREYDDGRGVVTEAETAEDGWHGYWLAGDYEFVKRGPVTEARWLAFGEAAEACGLDWGGRWLHPHDCPHVQFGGIKKSPSLVSKGLYRAGNIAGVWSIVGADAAA